MAYLMIEDLIEEVYQHNYPDERGPTLQISKDIHRTKYCQSGETFREAMGRVASTLKDDDEHFKEFREILLDMRFLPAGRVQTGIGSTRQVTPFNCFVSGIIEDNFVEGMDEGRFFERGGIMARACEATKTMRMGGGIGYDFSHLRPRRELIRSMDTLASGPVSFMHIYDAICRAIASAGHRRGAMMAVLRIDHPDIEEFIHAKQNTDRLTGFNISIAVTDEFMEALAAGRSFDLRWNGRVYRTVDARLLWEQVMRSTWDWAEPGVIFIDTINRMNNLWYCEKIETVNPCSEQPLPPYGACLLGSFNLAAYIDTTDAYDDILDDQFKGYSFDWEQFVRDIPVVVRAMDNVTDKAMYPLSQQSIEAHNKRRMGIGITGLANAGEALGYQYGSKKFLDFEDKVMNILLNAAYQCSALLAKEKGSFPLYDETRYLAGNFIRTLEPETQKIIRKYGIRNSHLTSIAPTGTISLCADNISSSIEPVFDYSTDRTIMEFDGPQQYIVEDYGYRNFGVQGKRAADCSIDDHLNALLVASRRVDSAVSKTCNIDPNMNWEDFKGIYTRAYEGGAKGCTTFNIGGKRMGILNGTSQKANGNGEACFFDPSTGKKSCE